MSGVDWSGTLNSMTSGVTDQANKIKDQDSLQITRDCLGEAQPGMKTAQQIARRIVQLSVQLKEIEFTSPGLTIEQRLDRVQWQSERLALAWVLGELADKLIPEEYQS